MFTIREAVWPRDKPAALSFIDGLQAYERRFEPNRRVDATVAEEYFAEILRNLAAKPGAVFLAEGADGEALGWSIVYEMRDDVYVVEAERRIAYIAELYLVEAARGQGAGRALIGACEDWAKARAIPVLQIGVLPGNARTRAVYAKAGFSDYALQLRKYL